ncbi:cytochrome c-type biogenesis protein [Pseudochrobactrum sp. Wa41.01b-1]|uniref:cytochrome c-type biogenesis protein n=1 Tax=Pseudochrobactrum sp. Wa41.01b-1 TaxID=2864102 RepID=UPI00210759F9|nr:cytochrome c-type biogenesis protein [Pseudochrobactrum sp. Wa41.01b-1]
MMSLLKNLYSRSFCILLIAVSIAAGSILTANVQNAWAVNPDEILADPVLEKRARDLSAGLRCMVCQNQSIDDSDADLARDLRLLVRERLVQGDSDEQVIDFLVSRYGEFVLLKPRLDKQTIILWSFPVIILIIGISTIWFSRRKAGSTQPQIVPLNDEEKQRLQNLLDGK